MANFYGVTATKKAAKIKRTKELQAYIDKFYIDQGEGDMNVSVNPIDKTLNIWGYNWFSVYKYNDKDSDEEIDWDNDATDEFLEGLRKFIVDELIILCVGYEKCRYTCAWEFTVTPSQVKNVTL